MTILSPETHQAAIKFAFDTVFEENGNVHSPATAEPEPTWTDAEVETLKAAAYEQGMADARAEIAQQAQSSQDALLSAMRDSLAGLVAGHEQTERASQKSAVEIAHRIASTLAPALMKRHPMAEVKAVITDCLRHLHREPHLAVRVCEEQLEELRPFVEQLGRECGIEERIMLLSDEAMAAGDCRIEWNEGAVSRSRSEIETDIQSVIDTYMAALETDNTPLPAQDEE